MIRPATHEDLDRIVQIGAALHSETDHFSRCRYVEDKVRKFIGTLIESDDGFVMVVERDGAVIGGMAAVSVEQWFSTDKIATEISVFILPEFRGGMDALRLLRAFRQWAERKQVAYAMAGISTGIHAEKTKLLYEASGMRYVGPIMEFPMKERIENGN
jgi:L-amino acid N-acyltransferase YncA